jgi:hypothetical protein
VFELWRNYLDAARLGMQAQQVIALRTLRLCEGGPAAAIEAHRMVVEKMLAAWEVQAKAGIATATGRKTSQRQALAPYRRAVGANRRRLTRKHRRKSGG